MPPLRQPPCSLLLLLQMLRRPLQPLALVLAIAAGQAALPAVETAGGPEQDPGQAGVAPAVEGIELALPAPALLEIHPEGARVYYRLDIAAGDFRITLPGRGGGSWRVRGAERWSLSSSERPPLRAALPRPLLDLLAERNRIAAELRVLKARGEELAALDGSFTQALPRLAHGAAPDTAGWQATLDALLLAQQALDADRIALDQDRARLLDATEALAPVPGCAADMLGLGEVEPQLTLAPEELARRWDDLPLPAERLQTLQLAVPAPAHLDLIEERTDIVWTPGATLVVAGKTATLERQVRIRKSRGLDLGTVAVLVSSAPLLEAATPATAPMLALGSEPVMKSERTSVITGSSEGSWAAARSDGIPPPAVAVAESGAPAPAAAPLGPEPAAKVDVQNETPATGGDAPPVRTATIAGRGPNEAQEAMPPTQPHAEVSHVVQWTLPAVALLADSGEITADLPPLALAVVSDEWALVPEISPVAMRRLGVRLDEPFPAEPLELVVDGQPRAAESLPAAASGTVLQLRVAEDPTIFVGSDAPWDVDPAAQTDRHQRHGHDRWIWNLGTRARLILVYATMPVSHSEGISVLLDDATTPQGQLVMPGMMRWNLLLTAGVPTRLGLGWQIDAASGLHL